MEAASNVQHTEFNLLTREHVNLKYAHSDIVSMRIPLALLVWINILLQQTSEVVFKGFAKEEER